VAQLREAGHIRQGTRSGPKAWILGAGWAALTNGFPIVHCPPMCEEARPLTDLRHVGSIVFGILLALVAIWSLWCARVGSCRPLRQPWWSGLSSRWRTPRSRRRADSGMNGCDDRWHRVLRTRGGGSRQPCANDYVNPASAGLISRTTRWRSPLMQASIQLTYRQV